jgi:hypothetical protein
MNSRFADPASIEAKALGLVDGRSGPIRAADQRGDR